MIVYRDTTFLAEPEELIKDLHRQLRAIAQENHVTHDSARTLLIQAGQAESALVDALLPSTDSESEDTELWRKAGLLTGLIFYDTWMNWPHPVPLPRLQNEVNGLRSVLDQILLGIPPARVRVQPAEGYAFYGLYPETYLEAARLLARGTKNGCAVCIGLRSIGSSLSSVVGAALHRSGWRVSTFTVRPRGNPLDRHLNLSDELQRTLAKMRSALFLIVDEGPGLSGSSMMGTAKALSRMDVSDSRIILFPSWLPDSSRFLSATARARWPLYSKCRVSFEDVWLKQHPIARGIAAEALQDISAGKWRGLVYRPNTTKIPAVHPQHERLKFIWTDPEQKRLAKPSTTLRPNEDTAAPILLRFSGLGYLAESKRNRAMLLAEARFCPPIQFAENGFIALRFARGTPQQAGAAPSILLDRISEYLCFVRKRFTENQRVTFEQLAEMMEVNLSEVLAEPGPARSLARIRELQPMLDNRGSVALDGRMLPHEWLLTSGGYLKVDAIDHCADHFFPGPQDIAWDVAATCIEFGLTETQQSYLVRCYERLAADRELNLLLPLYLLAYSAYRLGYSTLAAQTLEGSADGDRFTKLRTYYRRCARGYLAAIAR